MLPAAAGKQYLKLYSSELRDGTRVTCNFPSPALNMSMSSCVSGLKNGDGQTVRMLLIPFQ